MIKKSITIFLMCLSILSSGIASETFTAGEEEASHREAADAASSKTSWNDSSNFFSAEDDWLDVSGFLDQAYGFLPIAGYITEPAVGYGMWGGLAFMDRPLGEAKAGYGRPNVTFVGGMGTQNGTRGVMAGDMRHWMDERLQTIVGVVKASVNLDFYGIGEDSILNDNPKSYNLDTMLVVARAKYRIARSNFWGGVGYAIDTTTLSIDAPDVMPDMNFQPRETHIGGLAPTFSYDSRDNIFTPLSGTLIEATAAFFAPVFGSDDEFQRHSLIAIQYIPLYKKFYLGLRGDGIVSAGEAPFYMRPYIALRGAPVMRYQGEEVAQVETELRWQCWKRFSILGFAGYGAAWNDLKRIDNKRTVTTVGAGFRYELARVYGMHCGVDFAFGPDEKAIYIQFGNAWSRP